MKKEVDYTANCYYCDVYGQPEDMDSKHPKKISGEPDNVPIGGVACKDKDCSRCGWDPVENQRRMARLEQMLMDGTFKGTLIIPPKA